MAPDRKSPEPGRSARVEGKIGGDRQNGGTDFSLDTPGGGFTVPIDKAPRLAETRKSRTCPTLRVRKFPARPGMLRREPRTGRVNRIVRVLG